MTRIVAGVAGSVRLDVPPSGTRPTSDRVREALFSGLEARDAVYDARVLDLYAGSGALGLEAASRGAASVTLVEKASVAARVCRSNITRVTAAFAAANEEPPPFSVSSSAVASFLGAATAEWDLVFIDPPYGLPVPELEAALQLLVTHLAVGALIVVERATRDGAPPWPPALEPDRSKTYGETTLWFAIRV